METDFNIEIKRKFLELLSNSSSHGIPNIIKTHNTWLKLMWFVFFLISLGCCSFLIISGFVQYFSYEVVTSIRIVNDVPTEFPKITICNANLFTNDFAFKYLTDFNSSFVNFSNSQLREFFRTARDTANRNLNLTELRKFGFTLEDSLLDCEFSQRNCSDDFEEFYHPLNGNCWHFNVGKNVSGIEIPIKKTKEPRYIHGLKIEMYVGVSDSLKKHISFTGAIINIGNKSFSSMNDDDQEMLISTGTESFVSMQRTFYHQLEVPYSDCKKNSNSIFYNVLATLNKPYTQKDCVILCRQKRIEDRCNCSDIRYFPVTKQYRCNTTEEIKCCDLERNAFFERNDLPNECIELCPNECDKFILSTTTSDKRYLIRENAEKYYSNEKIKSKYPNRNLTHEDLKGGFIRIHIYYDSLDYTSITESVKFSGSDLISNIGGTLGLFIGISVLSFVEIIEIIIEIFLILAKNKISTVELFKKKLTKKSSAPLPS